MKKVLFVLVAVLFLLALVAVPHATTYAAADATCASDPSSGPVGTDFVITCWGYTPNSYVYAYLVEPAGVATTLFANTGAIKVAADGSISYTQPSAYQPFVTLATGTWGFVAEEIGLAKSVIHRGETTFTITGGTEGVSGAWFTADPTTINKPLQGYDNFRLDPFTISFFNFSDPVTLSGGGFAPGEMVTIWLEPPNGGCPSMTIHEDIKFGFVIPAVGALYEDIEYNYPLYDSYGAQLFDGVKASASGEIASAVYFNMLACEGPWKFVARGNASGWGGETTVTVIGNSITTSAWLSADPTTASAMFERISFSGSGFASNEHVTCWLTSPQGRVIGFPNNYFITYNLGFQYLKDHSIMADAGGNVNFSMMTGSYYEKFDGTLIIGGVVVDELHYEFFDPLQSEGALGAYAMTCRGDTSGADAIARFTLTGGFVDP